MDIQSLGLDFCLDKFLFLRFYTQLRGTTPTGVWLCLPLSSAPEYWSIVMFQNVLVISEVFPLGLGPHPHPLTPSLMKQALCASAAS